ncbi:MAG TPA: hypothetical protein VHD32_12710 [Candidatus Didemnitutus sp.]|nr:hypothetical protein [Candidatus Didemnitutus sp.]
MKTFPPDTDRISIRLTWLVALVATVLLGFGRLYAEGEAKTHTLFAGVDISVSEQKELHPVEDVRDGSFIIHVGGKEVKIASRWGSLGLKVAPAMKISAEPAQIGNLVFERAYTPENNPAQKFARQQGEQAAVQQEMDQTMNMLYLQSITGRGGHGGGAAGPPGTPAANPAGSSTGLDAHLSQMGDKMHVVDTHQNSQIGQMQHELTEELYDAVQVDFELTAPWPAQRPYVVIMMRFHAKDAPPDRGQNWLYAAELDHLDQKPARIHLLKGGFPPGYALESYQIHVFDGQREIATNLSQEQVGLTPSEAYLMLRTDYLAAHKGATSDALAAIGRLGDADRQHLGEDLYHHIFYVKVSGDGTPQGAFADRELTQPAFDAVTKLVARVRFLPALANGRPVDGVAEFRFSQLHL